MKDKKTFPESFLWGASTSAFQIEGAYLEDLVKRVPGLVYNKKDNSLTYNGQPISEINVNGEAFSPEIKRRHSKIFRQT